MRFGLLLSILFISFLVNGQSIYSLVGGPGFNGISGYYMRSIQGINEDTLLLGVDAINEPAFGDMHGGIIMVDGDFNPLWEKSESGGSIGRAKKVGSYIYYIDGGVGQLDMAGNENWATTFQDNGYLSIFELFGTSSGGLIAIGNSDQNGVCSIVLDNQGGLVSAQSYGCQETMAYDACLTADGNVAILCLSCPDGSSCATQEDALSVLKVNLSGTLLWSSSVPSEDLFVSGYLPRIRVLSSSNGALQVLTQGDNNDWYNSYKFNLGTGIVSSPQRNVVMFASDTVEFALHEVAQIEFQSNIAYGAEKTVSNGRSIFIEFDDSGNVLMAKGFGSATSNYSGFTPMTCGLMGDSVVFGGVSYFQDHLGFYKNDIHGSFCNEIDYVVSTGAFNAPPVASNYQSNVLQVTQNSGSNFLADMSPDWEKLSCEDFVQGVTEKENSFMIYPNPSQGILFLDGYSESFIDVVTIAGVKRRIDVKNGVVDLTELASGLYILKGIGAFDSVSKMVMLLH